jgi:hypothetical protein
MPVLSVYLDECVDVQLAEALRQRGFIAATTLAAERLRASDEEQLIYASDHDLMMLTHNRRHFRRLHYLFQRQNRAHAGSILLPRMPLPLLTLRAAMMLDWIATLDDHHSRLFAWGALQDLLERGFRLHGYSEDEVLIALSR